MEVAQDKIISKAEDLFKSCHASSIIVTDSGKLLVAYMAGDGEGANNMAIWLSRKVGAGWENPKRIKHLFLMPHWNPVLFYDGGRVHLHYKIGINVQNWYTMYSFSDDEGESWSKPTEAVEGDYSPRVCVRAKIIKASDGTLLGPCSIENGNNWDSYVDISKDNGRTWQKKDIPLKHIENPRELDPETIWEGLRGDDLWENNLDVIARWDGVIQPTLWQSGSKSIHALMRTSRGYIYRSDSSDMGETWCEAYPTSLPNNNSGIDVVRAGNDMLYLMYNPISGNWGKRNVIGISASEDNGETWCEPKVILKEDAGEFSYPAIVSKGNMIYFSYTYNRENIISGRFEI